MTKLILFITLCLLLVQHVKPVIGFIEERGKCTLENFFIHFVVLEVLEFQFTFPFRAKIC